MNSMLKALRIIASIVLTVGLFTVNVCASGNVSYAGQSDGFIFEPGSDDSATDLFPDFKNIMPGDTVTDTVEIRNKSREKVKIYLRATGAEAGSEDFLSQMTLQVKAKNGSELFLAPADQTATLSDWTLLGTLSSGGKTELDLSLTIPLSMGDAFQDAVGYLGWQFKVEELSENSDEPKETGKPKNTTTNRTTTTTSGTPKTGDENHTVIFVLLMMISSAVIAVIVRSHRRHRYNR